MLHLLLEPGMTHHDRVDVLRTLDGLRPDLDLLRDLKGSLDQMLASLPEGSLGRGDLLGDAPRHRIFIDNVHLTPEGTRLAGEAIAKEVLRRLR